MANYRLKKGLDLPISGKPEQVVSEANAAKEVALVGLDYAGLKPSMLVKVGDKVKKGQAVYKDKKTNVLFTSPAGGTVEAINRGDRRLFLSLVIKVDSNEEEETFETLSPDNACKDKVTALLTKSGMWTALRQRPFGKVADPSITPCGIFVAAMDTNPLAADAQVIINERFSDFENGLNALKTLGKVHVSSAKKLNSSVAGVSYHTFTGPHPAGNAGTHIHMIDPVGKSKSAWHLDYQDVMAIGALLTTGKIDTSRVVSLAGPGVRKPRLVKTRIGANLADLTSNELTNNNNRVISGSVLNGRTADGAFDYLGRYSMSVSALAEGRQREFLGWASLGFNKFSVKNTFLSKLSGKKNFAFDTNCQGSLRALMPIGSYEKVMPLDIEAAFLLRSLLAQDTDGAQELGVLELIEEDVSLMSYVCPGKIEYDNILRENLTIIERDG